jgi:hypothetical protein
MLKKLPRSAANRVFPQLSLLQASSSDVVPPRTDRCRATPVVVVRCKQSNDNRGTTLGHLVESGRLDVRKQTPFSHAARQNCQHRRKTHSLWTDKVESREVSRDDASKESTMPKAPSSLIRNGLGFHLETRAVE